MTLNLIDEYGESFSFSCKEVAERVMEAVLDSETCPYEAQVDVTLTSDEEIHQINLEHRQIDRATDVLSFPMTQFEIPGNFDFLEEEGDDCFDPDTGELLLGDIVISVDHLISQAEEFGHSQLREFAFLVAHSMYHLIGYDHMKPEEASIMEEKQKAILDQLQYIRD